MTILDDQIPRVKAAFGGETNAEVLAKVKTHLVAELRNVVLAYELRVQREAVAAAAIDITEIVVR